MRTSLLGMTAAVIALAAAGTANAGCEFATGPCYTDSHGNTYRTEQNFGGGYNTYKNGSLYSQTQQNLGGGWIETTPSGTRSYNYDPYVNPGAPKYDAYGNELPDYQ